jgi:CheY-like chemotaxis protein
MGLKPRLLCVDDDPVAVEIFKGIFQDDYIVQAAMSGEEALEKLSVFRPDIVLLDAVMPGINGWEVCSRIKNDPSYSSVRIIMVSAHAVEADNRRKGYVAGADDYVIKPYINEDLLAKVQVWTRVQQYEDCIAQRLKELESLKEQLQKANDLLESKVKQRTGELAASNEALSARISQCVLEKDENDRLRSELLQSQKLEAIGLLAGGMAHNFNNLLGGIMGSAELVKAKLEMPSPLLPHINRIHACCERGADLVRQLLAFARKGLLQKKVFDINVSVYETVELLKNILEKSIVIRTGFAAKTTLIFGDKDQIQTAIISLALNARDAMPNGGILTISTENVVFTDSATSSPQLLAPGSYVKISVTDTGAGMDSRTSGRIFEPFFTTKESGGFPGIGLASVYGCVKQHGGHIDVESKPDHGTSFLMYIPLMCAGDKAPCLSQDAVRHSGSGRVMVIDDDKDMCDTVANIVDSLGYSVTSCCSGNEALDVLGRAGKDDFHAIIIDAIMPDMNGKDCLSGIRALRGGVPVVMCSGYDIDEKWWNDSLSGRSCFLRKPFTIDQVAAALSWADSLHLA